MKKKYIFVFFLLCFFAFSNVVKADRYYIVTNDTVNVRTDASKDSTKIDTIKNGASYDLLNKDIVPDKLKNGTCDSGWYNINFNNQSAYICSDYAKFYQEVDPVVVDPSGSCEKNLNALGFPSSYWQGICTMQKAHPNWQFRAVMTNLDWQKAVEKESTCGKSYIATSNSSYIDSSCNNPYSKTWYPASQKAVANYMDPRNWLTDKYVFQFEYLKYENSLSGTYASIANNIIKNTQFYKYHIGIGNDLGNITNTAGKDTNVSPVFLAARMYQELGTSDSLKNLYQGNYTGDNNKYKGYYNFFNYGVSDSCVKESGTTYCGLNYAKNNGWNSPYNAIKGASKSLSSSYISVGQYTTYLQKFNVVPTSSSKLYIHQYMTNIAAPSSESKTTYNSYSNQKLLDSSFVFYIPVYNNMGATISNSSNGAIDDTTTASKEEISSIVTLSGHRYDEEYISKINPGTKVSDLKGDIEGISGTSVVITDSKGNKVKDNAKLGTGYLIKISNNTSSQVLKVVIKGDTSGDGEINALDLLQIQKSILGTYTLKDEYKLAANTSGDNKVNALDLLQVQKSILGTYKIEQ